MSDDRQLLRDAILSSIPAEPSQFDEVEPQFVFVPQAHVRALSPDAMLVEGIRGAGKSFWWHVLRSDALRNSLAALRQEYALSAVTVSAGFGQGSDASWPTKDELHMLIAAQHAPRLIWKSVVLRQVAADAIPDLSWRELVKWVEGEPSQVAQALRAANERLRQGGRKHVVLFDALDLAADSWEDRRGLLRGLLELTLELRALSAVRAKIFVRPDMLNDPLVQNFADASKVVASRVSLAWTPIDLYGLLFRYLANGANEDAAAAFRRISHGDWKKLADPAGWQLPADLRTDVGTQERVFVALAGPWMGRSASKGKTYTWMTNHLADAFDQVSPRSFLAAIRAAAEAPEVVGQTHPLHWTGLHEGVRKASEYRAIEIKEDLPWAHRAMTQLADIVVPCETQKMIDAWLRGGLPKQLADRDLRVPGDKKFAIFQELRAVGILRELSAGRVNIPDVYRVGFGLRRKGGFAPR